MRVVSWFRFFCSARYDTVRARSVLTASTSKFMQLLEVSDWLIVFRLMIILVPSWWMVVVSLVRRTVEVVVGTPWSPPRVGSAAPRPSPHPPSTRTPRQYSRHARHRYRYRIWIRIRYGMYLLFERLHEKTWKRQTKAGGLDFGDPVFTRYPFLFLR